jgi:hypothetical protein
MAEKPTIYMGVIAVLILAVAFLLFSNPTGNVVREDAEGATSAVKDIYRLITGEEAEILNVSEESGLYRITSRFSSATGIVTQDVYITKDGKLITANIAKTDEYKKSLQTDKEFVQCLSDKSLIVLGANDQASLLQLQVLGQFSSRIYFDCSSNVEICQKIGVESVPSLFYDNVTYPGVQTLSFVEELTGCQYNSTA